MVRSAKHCQGQISFNKVNPILFCTSFEKTGRNFPWVMARLAAIISFCASMKVSLVTAIMNPLTSSSAPDSSVGKCIIILVRSWASILLFCCICGSKRKMQSRCFRLALKKHKLMNQVKSHAAIGVPYTNSDREFWKHIGRC